MASECIESCNEGEGQQKHRTLFKPFECRTVLADLPTREWANLRRRCSQCCIWQTVPTPFRPTATNTVHLCHTVHLAGRGISCSYLSLLRFGYGVAARHLLDMDETGWLEFAEVETAKEEVCLTGYGDGDTPSDAVLAKGGRHPIGNGAVQQRVVGSFGRYIFGAVMAGDMAISRGRRL